MRSVYLHVLNCLDVARRLLLRAYVLLFLRDLLNSRHPYEIVDLLDLHVHQPKIFHLVVRELDVLRVCLPHYLNREFLVQILRVTEQLGHLRNNLVVLMSVSFRKVAEHLRRIAAYRKAVRRQYRRYLAYLFLVWVAKHVVL